MSADGRTGPHLVGEKTYATIGLGALVGKDEALARRWIVEYTRCHMRGPLGRAFAPTADRDVERALVRLCLELPGLVVADADVVRRVPAQVGLTLLASHQADRYRCRKRQGRTLEQQRSLGADGDAQRDTNQVGVFEFHSGPLVAIVQQSVEPEREIVAPLPSMVTSRRTSKSP